MGDPLDRSAALLRGARAACAFTGAGVSTESGIPDFRSAGGLWRGVDPMAVASIQGFEHEPDRFYAFWRWRHGVLQSAKPNAVHRWLAALEAGGRLRGVVTQNIDGLHRLAGSRAVHELHGCFRQARCDGCAHRCAIETALAASQAPGGPRCPDCGARLRPDVTLFGELLPPAFDDAVEALSDCDLLLVLGTSLSVYPAAQLVPHVREGGGAVVLVNAEPTPMDALAEVAIHGQLGQVAAALGARAA